MSLLHRTRNDDRVDEPTVRSDDPVVVHRPDGPPVVERRDDDTTVHEVERTDDYTIRERTSTFAPGQLVSLAVGVGFVALGLVAMLRAGIDGSFGNPTVEVLGLSHTAWLGLAEVGLGVLLVLAGTGAWGRPLSVLLGAGMIVAGVLVRAVPEEMPDKLGLEQDFGVLLILAGALVALSALILPVWRSHKVTRNGVTQPERSTVVTR
jgi:hypothetical protein